MKTLESGACCNPANETSIFLVIFNERVGVGSMADTPVWSVPGEAGRWDGGRMGVGWRLDGDGMEMGCTSQSSNN